jgi:hypothetical protein
MRHRRSDWERGMNKHVLLFDLWFEIDYGVLGHGFCFMVRMYRRSMFRESRNRKRKNGLEFSSCNG